MNRKHAAALTLLPLVALGLGLVALGGAPQDAPPGAAQDQRGAAAGPGGAATSASLAARAPAREARRGAFWAPVGSRFTYALDTATDISSAAREADGMPERRETQRVETGGKLVVELLARRDREAVVAFTCPELGAKLPGGIAPQGELEANLAALRGRTLARVDVDGRVLGYRFADGLAMTQRDWVRGLFGGFAFVVDADGGETWTAVGADSAGEFEASYRRIAPAVDELQIERTKLRYVAQRNAAELPLSVSGAAHATIAVEELGWLRRARLAETTHVQSTELPIAFDVAAHASLELVSHAFDPTIADDDAFDGDWAPASGHGEDATAMFEARAEDEWKQRLAGKSLRGIAGDILEELLAGRDDSERLMELWNEASWLLKLSPEAIAELRATLADPNLEPKAAALWLAALAKAGTPTAQSLLLEVFGDAKGSLALRGAAAAAMFDVVRPTAELAGGVAARIAALDAIDPADATAVLALGALARRDAKVLAGERCVLEAVEGWQERARRLDAEDLWLDALANAKSPKLEIAARDALSDGREHVREAGMRALGQVEGDSAFTTLREVASGDAEPRMRCAALQQLATRNEPAARDALLTAAETDQDAFVRQTALTSLARKGVDSGDEARLTLIAQNDADENVRELARRMLRRG